jgi:hypothetical protein
MAFRQPRKERDTEWRGTDPERRIRDQGQGGVEHDEYHRFQLNADVAYDNFKLLKSNRELRFLSREQWKECLALLLQAVDETKK